jgi:hypothetical protein
VNCRDLSGNPIQAVDYHAFTNLIHLEELDLGSLTDIGNNGNLWCLPKVIEDDLNMTGAIATLTHGVLDEELPKCEIDVLPWCNFNGEGMLKTDIMATSDGCVETRSMRDLVEAGPSPMFTAGGLGVNGDADHATWGCFEDSPCKDALYAACGYFDDAICYKYRGCSGTWTPWNVRSDLFTDRTAQCSA